MCMRSTITQNKYNNEKEKKTNKLKKKKTERSHSKTITINT